MRETHSGDDNDGAPKNFEYTLDAAGPLSQVLTASSGKNAAAFLYGLGRIAAIGRDTRYYGTDVRGSVRTTTDERGKVTGTESYDAWGVPTDEGEGTSQLASLFGFTGERQDAKAGLEYLRARWSSPALGVFLSPDPARGRLADPRSLSPYAYAMDDPTSKVDRSGLSATALLNGTRGYSYSGIAFYTDPSAQPSPASQPFGQSAAYALARMFADLDSPDPGTQAAAFLKISAVGVGVGVTVTAAAALIVPNAVAAVGSGLATGASAVAAGAAAILQRGQALFQGTSRAAAPPVAVEAQESAASIISRTAQAQSARGVEALKSYLSRAEQAAFEGDPSRGSRFLGQAVHRATTTALRAEFPGRFIYQTHGPDFIDTATGEVLELTTPGQVLAHMARAGYEGISYSTYVLP